MEDGLTLKSQRLEGVTGGMAEVEGLADAVLGGVFGDDALLDGDAFGKHGGKGD